MSDTVLITVIIAVAVVIVMFIYRNRLSGVNVKSKDIDVISKPIRHLQAKPTSAEMC